MKKTSTHETAAGAGGAREPAKRRIFLVDDHPLMRNGLKLVIDQQDDLCVCGEASSAAEALQNIAAARPVLALVDISLSGKSGIELIKDFRPLYPGLLILVMSMHDEVLYAERALRVGARGYVMKRSGGEALLAAIREVLAGRIYLSQRMSDQILGTLARPAAARKKSPIQMLTDREFEVLTLLGEGCATNEIAQRLHISPKTVDVYRQSLKSKLELTTTTSLIQYAVRWVESESKG